MYDCTGHCMHRMYVRYLVWQSFRHILIILSIFPAPAHCYPSGAAAVSLPIGSGVMRLHKHGLYTDSP